MHTHKHPFLRLKSGRVKHYSGHHKSVNTGTRGKSIAEIAERIRLIDIDNRFSEIHCIGRIAPKRVIPVYIHLAA